MKRIFILLISLGIMMLAVQVAQAQVSEADQEQTAATQADSGKAVNVGNKVCPVLGEKIDENSKATYEYKRKIYNLCCSGCVETFKSDPEKYAKIAEDEVSNK